VVRQPEVTQSHEKETKLFCLEESKKQKPGQEAQARPFQSMRIFKRLSCYYYNIVVVMY